MNQTNQTRCEENIASLRQTKREAAARYWQERRLLSASIASGRRLPRWEHDQRHRALNLKLTWRACRYAIRRETAPVTPPLHGFYCPVRCWCDKAER